MAWRRIATSHYLNECWPDSLTHICGTRGRWVKAESNKIIIQFRLARMLVTSTFTYWNFVTYSAPKVVRGSLSRQCNKMCLTSLVFVLVLWNLATWQKVSISCNIYNLDWYFIFHKLHNKAEMTGTQKLTPDFVTTHRSWCYCTCCQFNTRVIINVLVDYIHLQGLSSPYPNTWLAHNKPAIPEYTRKISWRLKGILFWRNDDLKSPQMTKLYLNVVIWTLSRHGESKSSVEPSYENIGYKTSTMYIIIMETN